MSVVSKKLLKREGRQPHDLMSTGEVNNMNEDMNPCSANAVMSLDLVTKRYTALAPMSGSCHGGAGWQALRFGWRQAWFFVQY